MITKAQMGWRCATAGLVTALTITGCTDPADAGADRSAAAIVATTQAEATGAPVTLPAPTGDVPTGWRPGGLGDGEVTFALPPDTVERTVPNPDASGSLIQTRVGTDENGTAYSVLYQVTPTTPGPEAPGDEDAAMREFVDAFGGGAGISAETYAEQRFVVQGRSGVQVTGFDPGVGLAVHARYVVLDSGGLGLVVLASDAEQADAAAEQLFGTLVLR